MLIHWSDEDLWPTSHVYISLLFLSPNSSVTALCYHGTLLSAKIFRSVHQMPHTEILKIFTDITIRRKGEADLW